MNNDVLELLIKIAIALKDILLGGAGGVVAYMFDYSRKKNKKDEIKWSNSAMIINMFIGAFIAYTLGNFLPYDLVGRDGYIGLIGVTSYAIMGIIESRFATIIMDRLMGGE